MKVAIRADASPDIGSGHVMRCLTLANALAARGAQVRFLCRTLPPHLAAAIESGGHQVAMLEIAPPPSAAPQAAWPAAYQAEDARAASRAVPDAGAHWLVADHYGLDRCWETAVRPAARRIMAIDDLGRDHDCDLLLDQTFHAEPHRRYRSRTPRGAQLLLGPSFALLRPEFLAARAHARVRGGSVQRVLVFMGGMDAGNATGLALQAISLLPDAGFALDVVIGPTHPDRAAVEQFCRGRAGATCHVQTRDMAALLAACDLAIGAGGGAQWERCCLGVPTLALALAENQRELLDGAARAGLAYAPDGGVPPAGVLAVHLQALLDNAALRALLSAAGLAAVDGRGAQRVAAAMAAAEVTVRLARDEDREQILAWRNDPAVRAASRHAEPIAAADHARWFEATLRATDRVLLVGEGREGPLGVVRFDLAGGAAEVSIYLAPGRLGQGLGPGLLRAAEAWLAANRPGVHAIRAQTLAGNVASRRLFEQAGYEPDGHLFLKRTGA